MDGILRFDFILLALLITSKLGSCILPEYTFHPVFDVCIRAYYNTVTQAEAESTCGRDMAYLIITDSLVKIKAYETFMKKSRSWVGLYDQNAKAPGQDFRWNNGDSLSVTSTLWGPGEPTVYYNMEHCALGGYYLGGLADDVCDDKYLFACQENI